MIIMKKLELYPENISEVLCSNLSDNNCIFVFPTDTVMNSWIDWIILHPEKSGVEAVAFERFIAWDNFKGAYVQAKQEGKSAVPSILKKFFVSDFIFRNSQKTEKERLQVIINPQDEFAENAASFEDWITGNLPSLHFWKKRLDKNAKEYGEPDKEDKDYLFLYEEYRNFLEKNNLFEPAWVEGTDIQDKDSRFIIFYPEILEDYCDYEDIFASSDNITLCTLPSGIKQPKVYCYSDSRKELRQTMLRIIELVQSGKADWSEIALSVPDIDTYRPYIDREFSLYGIPYVIRAGQPLTKNSAGRIFREIYDCHNSNFSFDSVRALLLDECVPWKKEFSQIKEQLIREGNRMRCLCSPGEKNIWLQCFASKIKRLELGKNTEEAEYFEQLKDFYNKLHNAVEDFFSIPEEGLEGACFESIKKSWMKFKSRFLEDDSGFSVEANNIISRCITELEEIIKIEEQYKNCGLKISSPFDFFLKLLDEKTYTPQNLSIGVNIYKYKLSAMANFKYQFVIDASQKNLEVQNRRLTFLNSTKRSKLHLIEDDRNQNPTDVFIKLYAKNTDTADESFIHFSYAEVSFAGYAIAHSSLEEEKNVPDYDETDYILAEKNYILGKTSTLKAVTQNQKNQFMQWYETNGQKSQSAYHLNESLLKRLNSKLDKEKSIYKVSARGDLEKFFPCPRRWVFQSLLKLEEDSLDTSLMQKYDMGNLNHKILELVLKEFENKTLPFYLSGEKCNNENGDFFITLANSCGQINPQPVLYTSELFNIVLQKTEEALKAPSDFRDSILALSVLNSQKTKLAQKIITFLQFFLPPFENNDSGKTGFGGCTVVSEEKKLSLVKNNLLYYGILDCLLKTPESDWIIIDYKNTVGSIPAAGAIKLDDNKMLRDFQMPMYHTLLNSHKEKDTDIYGSYYYSISDCERRVVTEEGSKKDPPESFNPSITALDEYTAVFKETLEQKNFVPKQKTSKSDRLNVKPYQHCIECPYKTICRTTYTVAGEQIETEHEVNKNNNLEEK